MSGWIGVDFDGTLATYDGWKSEDHVGQPIKPMCDRVRMWLASGIEVKIFTARVSNGSTHRVVTPIQEFCMREFDRHLEITNVKDFGMIELWDDRAVRVETNTGRRLG